MLWVLGVLGCCCWRCCCYGCWVLGCCWGAVSGAVGVRVLLLGLLLLWVLGVAGGAGVLLGFWGCSGVVAGGAVAMGTRGVGVLGVLLVGLLGCCCWGCCCYGCWVLLLWVLGVGVLLGCCQ